MKKIVFFLVVSLFTAGIVNAQKPVITTDKDGWQKIGEAKVNFKTDKDAFLIMGKDKFKSVQLRVKDAPIHISDMVIEFDGGGTQNVELKSNFSAGSKSRVITVGDNPKGIKKVTFVYKTVPNSKDERAEIELWGVN